MTAVARLALPASSRLSQAECRRVIADAGVAAIRERLQLRRRARAVPPLWRQVGCQSRLCFERCEQAARLAWVSFPGSPAKPDKPWRLGILTCRQNSCNPGRPGALRRKRLRGYNHRDISEKKDDTLVLSERGIADSSGSIGRRAEFRDAGRAWPQRLRHAHV